MPVLDWIGKGAVVDHARRVPFRLLETDPARSTDPASENLIVEGDNLHALRALLPYYAGCVKCVYIDPPYNTGNEGWAYNDNVNSPEMRAWLGATVGKEAEDLSRHDKWLCMMYPRLVLLRELLAEDGVILASIGDDEVAHFRAILDDLFGSNNFVATLIWEKSKKGDAKLISTSHDYVLVCAKSKAKLTTLNTEWRRRKPGVDRVLERYQELRDAHTARDGRIDHAAVRAGMMAWYRGLAPNDPAKAHKHYNWSDDRGLYFPDNFHGPDDGRKNRPRYDIIHPDTGKPVTKPSTGWRWEEERTMRALAEKPPRIHFGPDETTIPNRKTYLREVTGESFTSVFYKDGRAGSLELEQIVGPSRFPFPKDVDVLAGLIELVTGPHDIVLDAFAGSGTTGQAVLELNYREGSQRRFVLVEREPDIAREVTAVRLRRVSEGFEFTGVEAVPLFEEKMSVRAFRKASGILDEIEKIKTARQAEFDKFKLSVDDGMITLYGLREARGFREGRGGGFRYARLGPPLVDEDGRLRAGAPAEDVARFVFFAATGRPLDGPPGAGPLVGVHGRTAVYLLGLNGDGVLTRHALAALPAHDGPRVVFGTASRLAAADLAAAGVTFRQIPYELPLG